MDEFDINRLTDFDFEIVCKDLFEVHLDLTLEIFTPGRDGGIDLRYMAIGANGPLIIQCKHWPQSTCGKLIRHLRHQELPKVNLLKPNRYILATSVRLTPSAKDKIIAALHPHIKSTGDIYGLHEIASLLGNYPEIVKRHLRLWLSSSTVLQAVLNKRILSRSIDLAQDAKRAALVYVPNPSYRRAAEILEEQHVCIVSGIPGIGKTTLAHILAFYYANHNFEVYEISEDVDEINAVWDDDINQFYYYDDFLGQTALDEKLHKNEDSRLSRILRRIHGSPSKRLILTTREYILEQARQRYERINAENFNPLTCVLSIGDYTDLIRAEILYNHVYFSDLAPADKACFANPAIHWPIITSPKFNPRLIDHSIRASISQSLNGEQVAQELLNNLISPNRLWDHIVQYQLNDLQIQILIVLFSFPARIPLETLGRALRASLTMNNMQFGERELMQSMKVLENTMIQTTRLRDGTVAVEYHNPSIRDYIREYVFKSPSTLHLLLQAACYFEQVEQLCLYFKRWRTAATVLKRSEIRADVQKAVLRTYRASPADNVDFCPSGDGGTFRRCSKALEIAEMIDSDEIRRLVREWFSSVYINDSLPNVDDVADIAKTMLKSKSKKLRDVINERMHEIIEYIIEDVSTWFSARYAHDALLKILTGIPKGSDTISDFYILGRLTYVENHLTEEAMHAIRYIAATSEVPSWLISDAAEIFAYASKFSNPEENFPGYTYAMSVFRGSRVNSRDLEDIIPTEQPVLESESDIFAAIDRMFGTLRGIA